MVEDKFLGMMGLRKTLAKKKKIVTIMNKQNLLLTLQDVNNQLPGRYWLEDGADGGYG